VPAGRYPHCRWSVFIGDEAEPYEQHPNMALVGGSKLAAIGLVDHSGDAEPGGWHDYSGPFDPGFQLEDLSHGALCTVAQEFAVQSHLLARAFMLGVSQRLDAAAATELGTSQWTGIAALTSERLLAAMAIEGDDIEAIAKVFQIHPCFHPRSYVDLRVEVTGTSSARISIRDCSALQEDDGYSWLAGLGPAPHPALDAIAASVNPRARCRPIREPADARLAWEVVIDPSAEPQPAAPELALAKISRGAAFQFERRRALRGE
jgi:hypothetical protein